VNTDKYSRALSQWPLGLRLALVGSYYAPVVGGIETHMRDIAKGLQSAGIDVTVACLARHPGGRRLSVGPAKEDGVIVRRVQSVGAGDALRWAGRLVEENSADLIHFHGFSRLLMLRVARQQSIPWVITPHGGILGGATDPLGWRRKLKSLFDKHLARRLLARAAGVIALGDVEAEHLVSDLGIERKRVALIPNALPDESLELSPARPAGSERFLVLSRLDAVKQVDLVIEALKLLPSPPGCDIAGPDAGEADNLRKLASALPHGTIRFHGPVYGQEKRDLLRGALALILPSAFEGGSITGLEAIAQETPVIVSDAAKSGLPSGGYITFGTGNVVGLSRQIEALRGTNVAVTRASASAARSHILTTRMQVQQLLSVYRSALENSADGESQHVEPLTAT
jgi:glycosyltransferase involved in cell wall biosynthesis